MRRRLHHLARLVLVVLVAATGLGLFAPTSAPASCAAPSLVVDGAPVVSSTPVGPPAGPVGSDAPVVRMAPGASFTVLGQAFVSGCNDTVSCTSYGPGCHRCDAPEPVQPWQDVALTLVWDGRSFPLGTADADAATVTARWDVTLPPQVVPGKGVAVLSAAGAQPVAIDVAG